MNIDAVAEAIVASMEEQCDFRHVGLIGAHVNWKSVAQAAIDALQLTDEWRALAGRRIFETEDREAAEGLVDIYNGGSVQSRSVTPWARIEERP